MFGFQKSFAIIVLIALAFAYGMRNVWIGIQIIIAYAIIKIGWNILTK